MAVQGKVAPYTAALPLVALAGCVDAIGWLRLDGLFVSFMSGTSTMLGVAAADGEHRRALVLAAAVGLFAAGAVSGFLLARWAAAWRVAAVLALVGVLLTAAWWLPFGGQMPAAACCLVAAMGALNAALPGIGGITFVTGALTRFAEALAAGSAVAWRHLGVWSAMVAGAGAGALSQQHVPVDALAIPAFAALTGAALAALLAFRRKRGLQGASAP